MVSALPLQNFWRAMCAILLPAWHSGKIMSKQQGQLPRPLSPASCFLSKASPKQPQDHSSLGSCPSVPAWLHWWSLTSSCWGHCSSLARTATALLLRCLVFQAVFTPTVFDPAGSARTFLNHTSSSPFLWPLWRDTHALDPQLLLSSSGTPLPSHPPTVWKFSPVPRKSLGTREQLCCWQGIRKSPISEDYSKHPILPGYPGRITESRDCRTVGTPTAWMNTGIPGLLLAKNCTSLIPTVILTRLKNVLMSQPAQP